MTATDTIRSMLDERGVEWRKTPHYSSESQDNETIFEGNGIEWYAYDHMNGRLGLRALRYDLTPEQAIEATLGSNLEAENEKLRKERDALDHLTDVLNATNDGLIAENAKLRELVRDVFTIHWHGLDCTECPKRFQDRCTHLGGCEWLGILSDLMRELGVEV